MSKKTPTSIDITADTSYDFNAPVRRLQAKDSDNELLDSKVVIPDDDRPDRFSWSKLWAFSGPGLLMSIAFLDPGNIEADLQSGAAAQYKLFWVLLWATVLGLLMQRLALRIGVVTGQTMAEIAYTEYRAVPRILIWVMMEVAIVGSDMQEVIGTAISLHLLSRRWIPLWVGVVVTILDTLTFVFLDKYGLRKLELFFAILITTMALTFGFEFFISMPDMLGMLKGVSLPMCEDCGKTEMMQAVGIVGACIMPHNLYLHSGLVKTRDIDRSKDKKITEANFYFLIESSFALAVSFVINLFVMAVFAKGMYGKTNSDMHDVCSGMPSEFADTFPENNTDISVSIYSGGVYLGCEYGMIALYIWAIGIFAAGQSSTMTGCYAGQFTMEGFLNLTWVRWKRVLFTRSIALLPTLYVAKFSDLESFSGLNDFLNSLMSIQLPFAVIPAIAFSSNPRIMGEFASGTFQKILSVAIFVLIVGINGKLVSDYLMSLPSAAMYGAIAYGIVYILICIYLMLHCAAALTHPASWINRNKFMRKFILGRSITEFKYAVSSKRLTNSASTISGSVVSDVAIESRK